MTPGTPRSLLNHQDADYERLMELTSLIGLRLESTIDSVIDGMNAAIENAIVDLVDSHTTSLLHASVSNNVEVIVTMMIDKKQPSSIPPVPAAMQYAVKLAQTEVSGSALRRAYHVGSDHLLAHMFDQVRLLECESSEKLKLFPFLAGWAYQYVDEVTTVVMSAFEEELRSSHERRARTTAEYTSRLLSGHDIDPQEFYAATGYRLQQVHIGALMWIEDVGAATDQTQVLQHVAELLAARLGAVGQVLLTPLDRMSARVWFGKGNDWAPVDTLAAADVIATTPGVRIAFGVPSAGPTGVCASVTQAEHVTTIARVSSVGRSHAVSYADEGMAVIARLAKNVGATRGWVQEVLGPLANDSEHAQRQRDTARVFLENASSYVRTAERLTMHRNSIKYRLDRAEEDLGHPLDERRLDTQLALAVCDVLGHPVLSPASDQIGGPVPGGGGVARW